MKVRELFQKEIAEQSERVKYLAEVLQVDLDWYINEISDGQRRRCQLLECLAIPRSVYLMDEITSDLDLYAREALLGFLKRESDERKATILYCTHIFDLSKGLVVRCCPIDDVKEYQDLIQQGAKSP